MTIYARAALLLTQLSTARPTRVAALCAVLALAGTAAHAQDVKAVKSWVTPAAADAASTTAFINFENPGPYEVYLRSATTDAAGSVEFRDAKKDDAVVPELYIPGYESVSMSPAGLHMRLVGVKRALNAGDKVAFTLLTELGIKVEVTATVGEP